MCEPILIAFLGFVDSNVQFFIYIYEIYSLLNETDHATSIRYDIFQYIYKCTARGTLSSRMDFFKIRVVIAASSLYC